MIDTAYNEVKVRLYGVDCPEKKQDFGRHAQLKAAEYIAGKEVRVDVVNVDRYGRKVGIVYVCADSTLNEILLLNGLAWSYDEYNKLHRERYQALERQAKAAKVGLWSQPTWVAPWDYRGSKRKAQK
jgi:endonuclease YncB( thermonuclease family)